MCVLKNMVGMEFNGCKVVSREGSDKWGQALWKCVCRCGKYFVSTGGNIRSGNTKSCGCYSIKRTKESNTTHGDSGTRLHNIWYGIIRRCTRPSNSMFDYYGGRGITVCNQWLNSYEEFKEWSISNGYADDLTIDRIDNDGGYTPNNCRWVTYKEQGLNKRNSRMVEFNGKVMNLSTVSEISGIAESTIRNRIKAGVPIDSPKYYNRKSKESD